MPHRVFADRIFRPEEDDGHDFERFVIEVLSAEYAEAGLVRRLGRGRDGAIDIVSEYEGETTIIECKYVGDLTFETSRARWRGEVRKHLSENLPKLASDSAISPRSPYRFWLDSDRPVRRYVFCVSANLTNTEARDLEKEIQIFFAGLALEPGLSVLSDLGTETDAITVKSWDHFDENLNANPTLAYRWFGGLPYGARLLETETAPSTGFHRFLYQAVLPFFRRSDFMAEKGRADLHNEDVILQRLENDRPAAALIVTGPGGVGKSRLSLELGRSLDKGGWLVVRLTRHADDQTVRDIVQAHQRSAKVAFILDYAEAASALDRIAEALREAGEVAGHRVRLLANCRVSALRSVEDVLVDLDRDYVTLASGNSAEADYAIWVTRKILDHGKVPDAEQIARICGAMPALASFAAFLFLEHRDRFDTQFSGLHETPDFHSWAQRRINMITAAGAARNAELEMLADIALSLPMPMNERNSLADSGERRAGLLRCLEDDRWVEQDGEQLVAAQDVLTDAIAAGWLLDTAGVATARVSDALRRAASGSRLETALKVLDRLSLHLNFGEVDGAEVVRRLIHANQDVVRGAVRALLSGRMLDQDTKIRILNEHQVLRDTVAVDRGLDGPLSAIAEHAASLPDDSPVRSMATILQPMLDLAVAYPHPSNMALRRAYTLFPQRYRAAVLTRIDSEPVASDTHYLIARMLKWNEDPEVLADRTIRWLEARGATDVKASFVYSAWLDAAAKLPADQVAQRVADVESYVLGADDKPGWLAQHGDIPEAQFVYNAWLDAAAKLPADQVAQRVADVRNSVLVH